MFIRRAKPADARGIAAVHVAAWGAAYRGLLPDDALDRLSVEDSAGRWQERIARPWGHIFVAERDGDVVGFAAGGPSQDEGLDRDRVGEIYVIYVHPDQWRQGVGAALLSETLDRLRDDGFEAIVLWVLQGNRRAIDFYEAAGFGADGASKIKRRADGLALPVVRYRIRSPQKRRPIEREE